MTENPENREEQKLSRRKAHIQEQKNKESKKNGMRKKEVLPIAPHCPSTGIINSTAMHKPASTQRFLGVESDDSKIEDQRL